MADTSFIPKPPAAPSVLTIAFLASVVLHAGLLLFFRFRDVPLVVVEAP